MKKKSITILSLLFIFIYSYSQPKNEVRAVWLTTNYGLDWPKTKADNKENQIKQQTELIKILDRLKAANFNTVLFQARTRGSVFYRSAIEPMSDILTGKVNGDPGYDPLEFVIDECHKRGMECQAWIVAIPLGSQRHINYLGKYSVLHRTHSICTKYKDEYFLNPASPGTKAYLIEIVREVINHYDVDGVIFDYLRYPEYCGKRFPDAKEYQATANNRSLEQWRRDNITEIVRSIYKDVKSSKPWVKVNTCPVGKYRDTSRYSSHGWNAFYAVSQDPQEWMREGIQDEIYPMMYFRQNNFYPFALDWLENSKGRHIVPALGTYFLSPNDGNWQCEDIIRQINFIRNNKLAGESHFRMEFLTKNTKNIYDELQNNLYLYPALQVPMTWLDSIPPTQPYNLKIKQDEDYVYLSWNASNDNDSHNAPMYVIYGSNTYPVDTTKPENIIAQRIRDTHYTYTSILPWDAKSYFAITAIDRYGNESKPLQEQRK